MIVVAVNDTPRPQQRETDAITKGKQENACADFARKSGFSYLLCISVSLVPLWLKNSTTENTEDTKDPQREDNESPRAVTKSRNVRIADVH